MKTCLNKLRGLYAEVYMQAAFQSPLAHPNSLPLRSLLPQMMTSKAAMVDRFPVQESIRNTDKMLQQWAQEQSQALVTTQQNHAQSVKHNKGTDAPLCL